MVLKNAYTSSLRQNLINLVAAQLGVAIVPRWTSRMATPGVRYVPLEEAAGAMNRLPLAAAWIRGSRDAVRDEMLAMLRDNLGSYAEQA
ncbi:LysR substrate-binding domain-containing protein [Microvirga sp. P5_D2]